MTLMKNYKGIIDIAIFVILIIIIALFPIYFFKATDTIPNIYPVNSIDYICGDSPVDNDARFIWMNSPSTEWKSFQIPDKPENSSKENWAWMRIQIPEYATLVPNQYLVVKLKYNYCEAYTADHQIYHYGDLKEYLSLSTPESFYHFIPLPQDIHQRYVYLRLYSQDPNYTGQISDMEIAPREGFMLKIVREQFDYFLIALIFIILGMLISPFFFYKGTNRNAMPALALSSLSMGIWLITMSDIAKLYIHSPGIVLYISCASVYLMAINATKFVMSFFQLQDNKLLKYIVGLNFTCLITGTVLSVLKIGSFLTFTKYYDFLLSICLGIIIFKIINLVRKGVYLAKLFMLSMVLLLLTTIVDIYNIFFNTYITNPHMLVPYGCISVVVFCIVLITKEYLDMYEGYKNYSMISSTNYQSLFQNMLDGFIYGRVEQDDSGGSNIVLLEMNSASEELLKSNKQTIIGENFEDAFPSLTFKLPYLLDLIKKIAVEKDRMKKNRFVKYGFNWYQVTIFSPMEFYFGMIISDVTEQKRAAEKISYDAYHDSLTGLFNRTWFEERLRKLNGEITKFKAMSIIVIDIDGLKLVNDTMGHQTGDQYLKTCANIITGSLENNESVSRIGGDEFGILMPYVEKETANKKVKKIIHAIRSYNEAADMFPISMSIGLGSLTNEDMDIFSVYKRADDHMYQYKLSQKGSIKSTVIDMLLAALSERDYVAGGHIKRLEQMALQMADKMNLPEEEKRNLILLSKMHDLGKIGIPDEILFKPGRLTDEEYDKMKEHSIIGFNIASRSQELSSIAKLILHHHEHWDGKGYPDGLKGMQIPLECRILSILDAYDAMTSERPYQKGIPKYEAISEIKKFSGRQFDPRYVDAFMSMIEEHDYVPVE